MSEELTSRNQKLKSRISVSYAMSKVYKLKTRQVIPAKLDILWQFFSSPANLAKITPPWMDFRVTSEPEEKVYAGQIIEYSVKGLPGIPMYWMTEITHVDHEKYFVDEQRFGPYSFWHHEHHFKEMEGGVEMIDIVHYKIPYWFFGDIANTIFVRNQVNKIFDYRTKKVDEIFKSSPR